MLKSALLTLATIALAACGAPPESSGADIEEKIDNVADNTFTPLPPTVAEADLWAGTWQLRNPDTGNIMIRWEVRVENDRWTGQHTMTEHFCQTQGAPRASACPFIGQGGSWESITGNAASMMLKATDPYQTDALFSLTMLTDGDGNAARAAISADHGFVTVNTELERAPG